MANCTQRYICIDNNFNILNGPDAPDLTIRELDKELIFTLSNGGTSNNINQSYSEKDPYITKPVNIATDSAYTFQGYLVYQLKFPLQVLAHHYIIYPQLNPMNHYDLL